MIKNIYFSQLYLFYCFFILLIPRRFVFMITITQGIKECYLYELNKVGMYISNFFHTEIQTNECECEEERWKANIGVFTALR